MGKTSFSGPVYGAKSLLWSARQEVGIVSTAAQTISGVVVPTGEDWLVTYVTGFRSSTQSTALVLSLVDDSTTIATVAITSNSSLSLGSTTLTPGSGEYEGVTVVSGSTLTAVLTGANSSAAALTSSGVNMYVYGYVRFNSTASTRTE